MIRQLWRRLKKKKEEPQFFIEDRDFRLKLPPRYPQPQPPKRLGWLWYMLWALCCVAAFWFALTGLYGDMGVDTLLLYPIVGAGTALFVLAAYKKPKLLAILGGALLAAALVMGQSIYYGMLYTISQIVEKINTVSAQLVLGPTISPQMTLPQYTFQFAVVLMLAVGYLVAVCSVWRRNFYLYFAATFPLLAIGMYFGLPPSGFWMAVLAVTYLAVAGMHVFAGWRPGSKKSDFAARQVKKRYVWQVRYQNGAGRRAMSLPAGTLLVLVAGICAAVSFLVFSPTLYNKDSFVEFRTTLNHFMVKLLEKREYAVPTFNSGDLTHMDTFEKKGKVDMEVTTFNWGNTLYLKGYTGSTYTGTQWGPITDKEERQLRASLSKSFYDPGYYPQNLAGEFLKYETQKQVNKQPVYQSTMIVKHKEIRNKTTRRLNYMPYYPAYPDGSGGMVPLLDLDADAGVILPWFGLMNTYEQDFYTTGKLEGLNTEIPYVREGKEGANEDAQTRFFMPRQPLYQKEAQKLYTKLPESGLEEIKAQFTPELYAQLGSLDRFTSYVQAYMQSHYTYDEQPGEVPEGEDFIEYFIGTNKKGFSAHFASAAVMMYRAAGIPARYAEGYVIAPTDFFKDYQKGSATLHDLASGQSLTAVRYELPVTDAAQHAWVEVYVDGIGWQPVEVTPGYENVQDNLPEVRQSSANLDVESLPVRVTRYKSGGSSAEVEPPTRLQLLAQRLDRRMAIDLLLVAAALFVVALVLWVLYRRFARLQAIRRAVHSGDYSDCVRYLYWYVTTLFGFAGVRHPRGKKYSWYAKSVPNRLLGIDYEELQEFQEYAVQAKFSAEPLDEAAYERCLALADKMAGEVVSRLEPSRRRMLRLRKWLW